MICATSPIRSLHMNVQPHPRMDVAADFKRAGRWEIHENVLPRRLFVRVKVHRARIHIDLMNELIVIADRQSFPASNRDLGRMKGALELHNRLDRKSTRLNSSHPSISYPVFCLKKKKTKKNY